MNDIIFKAVLIIIKFELHYLHYHDKTYDDFYLTAIFLSLMFIFIRKQILYLGNKKWFNSILKENRKSTIGLNRFSSVLFKMIYYCVIVFTFFYFFTDWNHLPRFLLGNNDNIQSTILYREQLKDYTRLYYNLQLGYHLHSFIYQFEMTHRKDFREMMTHHIIAMILIISSIVDFRTNIGIIIAAIHDIVDLVLYTCKVIIDTVYYKLLYLLIPILFTCWIYFRIYCLAIIIYHTSYLISSGYVFFLTMLLLLHLYWLHILIIFTYNQIILRKSDLNYKRS